MQVFVRFVNEIPALHEC